MGKKEKKVHNESAMLMEEDLSMSSKKSEKRKRKLQLAELDPSETSEICAEETLKKSKKSKKKHKNTVYRNEVEDSTSENTVPDPEQTLSGKEIKKDKKKKEKKKKTEETLGVVDTDILCQAEINLGLSMVDPVTPQIENGTEEHSSKKKKKKKDKESKVDAVESSSTTPSEEKSRNERAMQYLRLWHSKRRKWKFNKMLQVQLFHIMYDKSVMEDDDFEILLLYLDGLTGKGREKTKEDAKDILDKGETEVAGTGAADKEGRARQIYQILA